MNKILEGKRIMITGASDGIGERIAIDAAQAGARIAFCGLPGDDARETITSIRAGGGEIFFRGVDLHNVEEAQAFTREAVDFLGGLDGLVHHAGGNRCTGVDACTQEDLDWAFAVHFQSACAVSQAAYPALKDSGGGMIVFTSSIHARRSSPGFFPCDMAQAALEALIASIALEWGADGIQTMGIAPAMTRTVQLEPERANDPLAETELIEKLNSFYPLGRMCETSDISSLAVYLLSGVNQFISGQVITLDGGLSAHSGERW